MNGLIKGIYAASHEKVTKKLQSSIFLRKIYTNSFSFILFPMKKAISLLMIMQLMVVVSAGALVHASTTDEDLAQLLADLEGNDSPVEPAAADDTTTAQNTEVAAETETTTGTSANEEATAEEHQAAEDILDSMDSDKWAYAGPEKIEVKNVTTTGATIVTTQITYDGTPVTKYKIYYSDKTLATVQDFNQINDVIVDVITTSGTDVELSFEGLGPNQTYYIVVAPVHPTDPTQEPLSFISDEVMFTTQQAVAAPTEKVFENVSYTYKDSMVTLTWTPSSAAQKADIQIRHQSEATYTKVGTPTIGDGKFSFSVSKAGTYFLKMTGLDANGNAVGQEHIQTVKVDEVQKPTETVQEAPQVGPTTNIMIGLLIFAVLAYFVSRFRRIER